MSSDENIFRNASKEYQQALKNSGYDEELIYDTEIKKQSEKNKKQKRTREITWFNPPYNESVTTNLGKQFLKIIDINFPHNRKDGLQKIINRHSVKISYSCSQNFKNIIKANNTLKLKNNTNTKKEEQECNCQKKNKCPLDGKCKIDTVIYEATITTPTETKKYIGSTEGSFKQRFYGHTTDTKHKKNKNNTSLALFYWENLEEGIQPTITWKILKKCSKYQRGGKKCDVCLTEKAFILKHQGPDLLNKRSELMNRCRHASKHKLENLIPNQSDVKEEERPVQHGSSKKLNIKTSHKNSRKMNDVTKTSPDKKDLQNRLKSSKERNVRRGTPFH